MGFYRSTASRKCSGCLLLQWVFIAAPLLGSALAAFCYLGLAGKEKDKMADPNETAI